MKTLAKFLRFEGKLILLCLLIILVVGASTWKSFFRDASLESIRRDYLMEDISVHSHITPERLQKYSDQELEIICRLDLNGLMALEQHREATLRLYQELQDFQIFYEIIDEFGPQHVIPALDYFYETGNLSLTIEQAISAFIADMFNIPVEKDTLSERQKRLLAILTEIQYQKHNFLARFIYTREGAKRNYIATATSTISNFFTGGLSRLNSALVTRGVSGVTREELVDAGIDLIVLIPFASLLGRSSKPTVQIARGSKTTAALKNSRLVTFAGTSKGFWRVIPARTLFRLKYVKWYVLALAVVKPDLFNHAASLVAQALGIAPIFMKAGFWLLILIPVLHGVVPLILFLRFIGKRIFFPPGPVTVR